MLPQRRRRRRCSSSRCSSQRLLLLQSPGESLDTASPTTQAAAASAVMPVPHNAVLLFLNRANRHHSLRSFLPRDSALGTAAPPCVSPSPVLPALLLPSTHTTAASLPLSLSASHVTCTVTTSDTPAVEAAAVTLPETAAVEPAAVTIPEGPAVRIGGEAPGDKPGEAASLRVGGGSAAARTRGAAAASAAAGFKRAEAAAVTAVNSLATAAGPFSSVSFSRAPRGGVKLRDAARSSRRRLSVQAKYKRPAPISSASVYERGSLVGGSKTSLPSVTRCAAVTASSPSSIAAAAAAPPPFAAGAALPLPIVPTAGAEATLRLSTTRTAAAAEAALRLSTTRTAAAAEAAPRISSSAGTAAAASSSCSSRSSAAAAPLHLVAAAPTAASLRASSRAAGVSVGCERVDDELLLLHSDTGEEGSRTPSTTCSEYGKEIPTPRPGAEGLSRLINTSCSGCIRGSGGVQGSCCCSSNRSSYRSCCRDNLSTAVAARRSLLLLHAQQVHHHTGSCGVALRRTRNAGIEERRGNVGARDIVDAGTTKKRRRIISSPPLSTLHNEQQCLLQQHRHQEESLAVQIYRNPVRRKSEFCRRNQGRTSCSFLCENKICISTRRQRVSGLLSQQLHKQQQEREVVIYKMGVSATDTQEGEDENSSKNGSHNTRSFLVRRIRKNSSSSNLSERKDSSMKNIICEEERQCCDNRVSPDEVRRRRSSSSCAGVLHIKESCCHISLSGDRAVRQGKETVAAAVGCGSIAKSGNMEVEDKGRRKSCCVKKEEAKKDRYMLSVSNTRNKSVACESHDSKGDSQSCSSMKEEERKTHCSDKSNNSSSQTQRNNSIINGNTLTEKVLKLHEKEQRKSNKQQHHQKKAHVQCKKEQETSIMEDRKWKSKSVETMGQSWQKVNPPSAVHIAGRSTSAVPGRRKSGGICTVRVDANRMSAVLRRQKRCSSSALRAGAVINTGAGVCMLKVSDCHSAHLTQHQDSEGGLPSSFPAGSEKLRRTGLNTSGSNRKSFATGVMISSAAAGLRSSDAAAVTAGGVLAPAGARGHSSAPDDVVIVQQRRREKKHVQAERKNATLLHQQHPQQQQMQEQISLGNHVPLTIAAVAATGTRRQSAAGTPRGVLLPAAAIRLRPVPAAAGGIAAAKGRPIAAARGGAAADGTACGGTPVKAAAAARIAAPYREGSHMIYAAGTRSSIGDCEEEKDRERDGETKQQAAGRRQQQQQKQNSKKQEQERQGRQEQRGVCTIDNASNASRSFLTLLKQLRQRPQQRAVRGSGAVAAAIKRRHLAAQRRLLWKKGSVENTGVAQHREEQHQPEKQEHSQQQNERNLPEEIVVSYASCGINGDNTNTAAVPDGPLRSSNVIILSSTQPRRGSTEGIYQGCSPQPAPVLTSASTEIDAPRCDPVAAVGSSAVGGKDDVRESTTVSDRVVQGIAEAATEAEKKSCTCKSSKRVKLHQHVRVQPPGRLLSSLCSFCSRRLSVTAEQQHQCGCKGLTSQQQEQMQQQQCGEGSLQQRAPVPPHQQDPGVQEQLQMRSRSGVLVQQQGSGSTAGEERRGKKRRRCDSQEEIEEAQQKQQQEQQKQEVLPERYQIEECPTEAAEEKEREESHKFSSCDTALQKRNDVIIDGLLYRDRDNSRRENCNICGRRKFLEIIPSAPAAIYLAAAGVVKTSSPHISASCARKQQTTASVHTAESKLKKGTSRLDGIYWTSAVSRPSRRGRINSNTERKCNINGSDDNSKCSNSIHGPSRETNTLLKNNHISIYSMSNTSGSSGNNSSNGGPVGNSLSVRRGSEEDTKGRSTNAVSAGLCCRGAVLLEDNVSKEDSRKVNMEVIERQREHKEMPVFDMSCASLVVESAAAGEKGRRITGAVAKGYNTANRSVAAPQLAGHSDNERATVVTSNDEAVTSGIEFPSTVCEVGAASAAEFVPAAACSSPLDPLANTSVGREPLCTCYSNGNSASDKRKQRYRRRLKVRSSSAAARKARGGMILARKHGGVISQRTILPSAICVRHKIGDSIIPGAAISQQNIGNHQGCEVRGEQLHPQQQSEQQPQLGEEHQMPLQEQQTEDLRVEQQGKTRGEGFCVAYVRGLARRGGWERVPPSLLLLLLPSELVVKRSSNKKYSTRSGLHAKAEDATTGRRSGTGMPAKKHRGLLGRRGEIARLLLVQNEWEKASAVSRWKKAREAGRIETLESFRSRLRGEISPAAAALQWAGSREHLNAL